MATVQKDMAQDTREILFLLTQETSASPMNLFLCKAVTQMKNIG